jgi:hypothetical protein
MAHILARFDGDHRRPLVELPSDEVATRYAAERQHGAAGGLANRVFLPRGVAKLKCRAGETVLGSD